MNNRSVGGEGVHLSKVMMKSMLVYITHTNVIYLYEEEREVYIQYINTCI